MEEKPWYESRTNITALVLLMTTLMAVWFGDELAKRFSVPGVQEALVTLVMVIGVPMIIRFRNAATKLIRGPKK
jgi:uncharacterized membrane protein YfcA